MTRSGKLPVDSLLLQFLNSSTAELQRSDEHHSIEGSRIPPAQNQFASPSQTLSSSNDTSLPRTEATHEDQSRTLAGKKRHLSGGDTTIQADEVRSSARKRGNPDSGEAERPLTNAPYFASSADCIAQISSPSEKRQLKKRTSSSPDFTLSDAVATMLSRPEGTGSVRTVKLARGHPGCPVARTSSALSRTSSEQISRTLSIQEPHVQSSAQLLAEICLLELLQQDPRPTFIIDVTDTAKFQSSSLNLLFTNGALKARPELLVHVRGIAEDPFLTLDTAPAFVAFREWATSFAKEGNSLVISSPVYRYAGYAWTSSTLRKRIRVIACDASSAPTALSGTPGPSEIPNTRLSSSPGCFNLANPAPDLDISPDPASLTKEDPTEAASSEQPTSYVPAKSVISSRDMESMAFMMSPRPLGERTDSYQGLERSSSAGYAEAFNSISERDFFDWTRLPDSSALPPHLQFARSVNWAATSLGPIENWDADLRTMCNLIMASPHPAAMYWGPDLIAIYNEAYIFLAGNKHPILMGQSYKEAWAEIWDDVKDVFASAMSSAQATMKDDDCLFINREDYLEETYFSWSIVPIIGGDGSVVGLYNPAFEKTRRKIAERRMLTLREIGERTATAREVSKFWPLLLKGLGYNEVDAPLVLIYSVAEDADNDASLVQSGGMVTEKTLLLEGWLGIPPGHRLAPKEIDLSKNMEGFAPIFRDAIKADKPLILSEEDGTLDRELLEGIQWRGYGDPSPTIVVCPIQPTTGESTLGFLVMGTNPRRPFDEDYNLFVQLLARQVATSVASVVLFEEEIRKGRRAARLAAQDRIELSNQLAARTQEAVESETKFTRMAELAPVGMIIADSTGRFNYCNDTWYDLASYPKSEQVGDDWIDYIADDDRPLVIRQWRKIIAEQVPISSEFRFKPPWQDKEGPQSEDTWVLFSAYPEKGPDGQVERIFGTVTDISTQKFAGELQKRRMEEAVELKRQQETFIDITSHEMRNPLSAILQCADEIASSLTEAKYSPSLLSHVLDSTIDAAQTITLCAQHQRRVVDDVLTLSKLDSARLLVTPVDVQPGSVVQRALKMFDGELQTADISLDVCVDESIRTLCVDWVRLDPSRLLQILINLTTNAIKFTTTQEKRSITVRLGASLSRPSEQPSKTVDYVPLRSKEIDTTSEAEWGSGEVIYLTFAIQDTGKGLTEGEKKLLFLRFSQASPRTHITYGGSGLGLFISRELVELQGGEIGVSSASGKGSTFAFYIKTRRSSAPSSDAEQPLNASPLKKGFGPKTVRSSVQEQSAKDCTAAAIMPASTISDDVVDSPLRVLIVEDNLVNQKVLAKQLRKTGCIIHLANHGGEAIEHLASSRFWTGKEVSGIELDVILMDLEMPVMDGLTCTRKIRELQQSKRLVRHVPVIAVTANAREEQILMMREAGVDDVMPKPFRILEILPKMRALAEKSKR